MRRDLGGRQQVTAPLDSGAPRVPSRVVLVPSWFVEPAFSRPHQVSRSAASPQKKYARARNRHERANTVDPCPHPLALHPKHAVALVVATTNGSASLDRPLAQRGPAERERRPYLQPWESLEFRDFQIRLTAS